MTNRSRPTNSPDEMDLWMGNSRLGVHSIDRWSAGLLVNERETGY